MKIAFVSHHCCIRVIKEGLALYKAGHDVRFIQNRLANESFINVIPWATFFDNAEQLAVKVSLWSDGWRPDIVHVHNEPDWMTPIVRQVWPDAKIVHDCHDLNSARVNEASDDELAAIEATDALIFPSKGYLEHYNNFYGKDEKPKEIIYSMCLTDFMDNVDLPRCNGIVYEGGVSISNPSDKHINYRDYLTVAHSLMDANIPFYMFGVRDAYMTEYAKRGVVAFAAAPYSSLMKQLTRYDWGLCGSPFKCNQWDWAMPNKLFDYTAAGIPSIVFNADETAEFVEEHGIGVVIDSVEQIPDIYDKHEELREVVKAKRQEFCMENQVPKIEALYNKVLEG